MTTYEAIKNLKTYETKKKYKKMTAKELYKQIAKFTISQIMDLIDILSMFDEFTNEIPIRVLPIYELEDYLEVNYFDEDEIKNVMEESKQDNYNYFSFDWSNGFTFYKDEEDYTKTLFAYLPELMQTLKNNLDLIEVTDLLQSCENDINYRNYITFGSCWKKYCNYKPLRIMLQK